VTIFPSESGISGTMLRACRGLELGPDRDHVGSAGTAPHGDPDLAAVSVFLNQIPNGLRHSPNRKVPAMTAVTLPALQRGCSAAKQFGSLSVVKPAARGLLRG
jgi:hypothetical protein